MSGRPGLVLAAVAGFFSSGLTGCVGFSRQEPAEISAADSLSRAFALVTRRETLEVSTRITDLSAGDSAWVYVATVRFLSDGRLVASDLGRGLLYVLGPDGRLLETIRVPGIRFPYLLHAGEDTLVVHDAGAGQVAWITGGRILRRIGIPRSTTREALTLYAAATSSHLFVKRAEDKTPAELLIYTLPSGQLATRTCLPGTGWQFRGPLIASGDSVISVSAFVPRVHVFSSDARVDSLRLFGFDSPALNRTRQFVLGHRKDAPLLIPSIALAGEWIFVPNVRPDRTRIDVYDRTGRLVRILEESANTTPLQLVDLAAFPASDGSVLLAVAGNAAEYGPFSLAYRPRIVLYRWKGGS